MAVASGSYYSTYELRLDGLRKSVADAKAMFADLRKAKEEALGAGSSAPVDIPLPKVPRSLPQLPDTSPQTDRQAAANLRLAQAEARLLEVQGNRSGAIARITDALGQQQQRTTQVISAEIQLERAQQKLSGSTTTLGGALGQVSGALNAVGIGVGVAAIAQGAIQLTKAGAQAKQVDKEFNTLAKSAGTTGDALITALRSASGGEIDDLSLKLAANRAQMLGVASSADEMATLLEIARDRAKKLGTDTGKAFDDLVTGLGRASPEILDNLAIQVDAAQVNKEYAASIGKTVDQLTKQEKSQALVAAVVAQGKASLQSAGQDAESASGNLAALSAASANARDALGGLMAEAAKPFIGNAARMISTYAGYLNTFATQGERAKQLSTEIFAQGAQYDQYAARIQAGNEKLAASGASARLEQLSRAQFDYARSLQASGTSAEQAVAKAQQYGTVLNSTALAQQRLQAGLAGTQAATTVTQGALLNLASTSDSNRVAVESLLQAFNAGAASPEQFANAIGVLVARQQEHAAVVAEDAAMVQQASSAITAATPPTLQHAQALVQAAVNGQLYVDSQGQVIAATQQAADTDLLATTAKQQHGAVMDLLSGQTIAAANSFLALNPNISQSGIASAEASGKISSAVAQYIAMTLKTAEARAELARLQSQAGVKVATGGVGGGGRRAGGEGRANAELYGEDSAKSQAQIAQNVRRYNAQQQAAKDLAAAERNRVVTVGSAAEKQALYNKELADAERIYGKNSAQYVNARTSLDQFTQSQQKAAKAGGGGATAAEKGATKAAAAQARQAKQAQTFQNGMLADQDRYNDQAEQRAAQHWQKIISIEREAQKKSLDQQRKNEVDKRQSRAGFYRSMIGADIADADKQRIQAGYEADYAQAQQMARDGKVKQSQEFLAIAKEQRQQEIQQAQEVAEAQKAITEAKTKEERQQAQAKLAQIQEVQRMEADAIAEQRKQVIEGGDAIQNERQAAIDAENESYIAAEDKAAGAAQAAADRKIAQHQRSGQAIAAETAELLKQQQVYQQIGRAPGAPGATTPTPTTSTSTAPATPPPTTPTDGGSLQAVADAVQSGLNGVASLLQTLISKAGEEIAATQSIGRALSSSGGIGSRGGA